MRLSGVFVRSASLLALLGASVSLPLAAQTFAASTGTAASLGGDIPTSVYTALPAHHKKTDAPLIYARVRDGIYSVDGMVGKVQLNYDIKAASYLYLFVPGVGTAVVSLAPTPDGLWKPAELSNNELTAEVAGHTLNLTGIETLVNDKGKPPAHLYVRLDSDTWRLSRTPMMGFGSATLAPYQWPGALPEPAAASARSTEAAAPAPVPVNLLPRTVSYQVPTSSLR